MSRKTKLTANLQRSLIALIRKGAPVEIAAGKCGIGSTTVYDWLRRGEADNPPDEDERYVDFALVYRDAESDLYLRWMRRIEKGGPASRSIAYLAERRFPRHLGSEKGKTRLERNKLRAEIALLKKQVRRQRTSLELLIKRADKVAAKLLEFGEAGKNKGEEGVRVN